MTAHDDMSATPDARRAAMAAQFQRQFGHQPEGLWSAPGRVNLIGEHTDYNGGLVLPFAIDARAWVAVGRSPADVHRLASAQRSGAPEAVRPADCRPGSPASVGWPAYPFSVIWSLAQAGWEVPPVDILLDSTVPVGAGLSSSAAVECAVGLALSDLLGLGLGAPAIARIAQHGENDFVGMPCGLMDQMASAACIAGHALLFDTTAGSIEQLPFDTAAAGLTTLVIDTRVHHSLADGQYAARRADCDTAAAVLGLDLLGELTTTTLADALDRLTGPRAAVLRRRVRHVVTENDRVRRVAALLRSGEVMPIGPMLSASHASLRDDFEVSCPELDLAAETADRSGALGARMVGGGFGGSVIALAPADRVGSLRNAVMDAFAQAALRPPVIRAVAPEDGARRDALAP